VLSVIVPRSGADVLAGAEDFVLDFEDDCRTGLEACGVARGFGSNNVRIAIEYLVR
jgi:hypothetical protein